MSERETPVTQDELHAYVDGELAPDRVTAVEAWLAAHPEAAALLRGWQAQAEAIRARYGPLASQPVPARLELDRLARGTRSRRAGAAGAGFWAVFVGGGGRW